MTSRLLSLKKVSITLVSTQNFSVAGCLEKTIAQYAGRLHRSYGRKNEVVIYDYVDDQVPVLAGMIGKR